MELKIGPWVITSDKYQYKLSKIMPKTSKKEKDEISEDDGESKSGERLVFVGYYTEMEGVLLALLDRELKDLEVESIKELIEGLQALRVYIRKASNAIIDEVKKLPKEILKGIPDTDNEYPVKDALREQDIMMGKVDAKIENRKKGKAVVAPPEPAPTKSAEPAEPKVKGKRGRPKKDTTPITPPAPAQKMTKKGRVIK